MRIALLTGLVASTLFAVLAFSVQPAEAADMTFSTDTTITTNQTIGAGETWTIDSGVTLTIASGVTITNNGTIQNDGRIDILSSTMINNSGILFNFGIIESFGTINNNEGGTINNNEGVFISNNRVNNFGTVNNAGDIVNFGRFFNYGTLYNSGSFSVIAGAAINSGTINNDGSIGIHNIKILINSGTINNNGTLFTATSRGVIFNTGTINNPGILENQNEFGEWVFIDNAGIINNTGTINNENQSIFTNNILNNKCGATFINTGVLNGDPAVFEECTYNLNLAEGADPSDGTVDLNQEVTADADTNDVSLSDVTFRWINPSGDTVHTTTIPLPPFEFTDEPLDTQPVPVPVMRQAEDMFTPNEVGDWTVEADFNNGVVVQETLNVPFMVIPESPIGIIALMGSFLAAFGGYAYLRQKRSAA